MGDLGLIPGLGRSPRKGNHYPRQYSGMENSMVRGAWQATVHEVAKSWTRLSIQHLVYLCLVIYSFPFLTSLLVHSLILSFRKWWGTKYGWAEVWQSGCEQRRRDYGHFFMEVLLQTSGDAEMQLLHTSYVPITRELWIYASHQNLHESRHGAGHGEAAGGRPHGGLSAGAQGTGQPLARAWGIGQSPRLCFTRICHGALLRKENDLIQLVRIIWT